MREWVETMRVPPDKTENGHVYEPMIHCGFWHKDAESGELKKFIGEDGREYMGLLNEHGEPLKIGEPIHILWFSFRPYRFDDQP